MLYLAGLSYVYAAVYLALFFGVPAFFNEPLPKLRRRSMFSIIYIVILYLAALSVGILITIFHPELGNRILHAVGGGVLAIVTCFFAIKDSGLKIKPFQFFVIGILVATFLGVGNEIAEYLLQNYFGIISAESINDTWLDLVSNTIGATLAAVSLSPFFRLYKRVHNS